LQTRRRARIVALQVLFEVDTVQHDPDVSLRNRLEDSPLPEDGVAFARVLLMGALQHLSLLDQIIQRIAPEWPIEQMAPVDRNILRLAAYEILHEHDTPPKVAINEAVEIAKLFGSDSSSRFVNGVLGTLFAQRQEILDTLPAPSAEANAPQEPGAPLPGGQSGT
jgi:transcription antitermination protein NusB